VIAVKRCLPEHVSLAWPVVEPWLRKANNRYPPVRRLEDDLIDLEGGSQQLWLVLEQGTIIAAVTTKVHDQPLMRVCSMRLTGGTKLVKWRALAIAEIKKFAQENGCKRLEQLGPKGWRRLNPEFRHYGEWLVMEL